MKTLSKIQVIIFLLFISICVNGQTRISVGPQIGLNISKSNYEDLYGYNYSYKTSSTPRFEAGIVANFGHRHIALQPSVLYSQKGFVLDGGLQETNGTQTSVVSIHQTLSLNYLTIPINIVYTQKDNGQGFQAFGGGYLGILLGGKVKYNNHQGVEGAIINSYQAELPVRAGNSFLSNGYYYSKRFDAGLQGGVGYQCAGALLQVSYSLGLTNVGANYPMNPSSYGPHYYNRTLQTSFTYFFKLNNVQK
jgi:hypothetical protein